MGNMFENDSATEKGIILIYSCMHPYLHSYATKAPYLIISHITINNMITQFAVSSHFS